MYYIRNTKIQGGKHMEEKQNNPITKKWWFWLIIGFLIIGFIGAIVGSDDSTNDSTSDSSSTTQSYYINDTVSSNSIQFTVIDVENTTTLGGSYVGATTSNNFIIVTLIVKNIGNSEITIDSSDFELKKGQATYEVDSNSIYLDNGLYILKSIGAGLSTTIELAFETPTQNQYTNPYTLKVKNGTFASYKNIILSERTTESN